MPVKEATVRTAVHGDDFDAVARLHADVYGREHGFGRDFMRPVEDGLAALRDALREDPGAGRLWVVDDGEVGGAIGVTRQSPVQAQIRWVVLDPRLRGLGLGRRLVALAVDYARAEGFESVVLSTIPQLTTAAHLYREAGFELVSETPGAPWGGPGVTQVYSLNLR